MAGLRATEADVRLGTRLKAARDAAGITQKVAALAVGVSAAQLQKYEKGTNAISALSLAKLAALYGRPLTDLLETVEAEPTPADRLGDALAANLRSFLVSEAGQDLMARLA